MNILKLDASARQADSNSRTLADYLVTRLGGEVLERDLAQHEFPVMTGDAQLAVYGGSDDPQFAEHLQLSETLTSELLAADTLVIGAPMYNFGVPVYLKQWIDYVCRAGVTFRYTSEGPEGLSGIEDAYIVTSSGGTPVGSDMDFSSRYLQQVCRFLGVKRLHVIDAGGSKRDPEAVITHGKAQIDALVDSEAAA